MKTKKVTISFTAYVDEDAVDEIVRHVDHHLDYLVNLSEYPEIKGVCDAKATPCDS